MTNPINDCEATAMKHQSTNVLVVDWDYFFPIDPAWDWAHAENQLYIESVWPLRAADFVVRNQPLPTSVPWAGFWERFTFTPEVKLYYADSNVLAYPAITGEGHGDTSGIWLFDQHHDCGYLGEDSLDKLIEGVTCEDWMIPLGLRDHGRRQHVLYPSHRDPGAEPEPYFPKLDRRYDENLKPGYLPEQFDLVFVCRSGAWVPPWEDDNFDAFVDACPVELRFNMDDVKPRNWEPSQVDALANVYRKAGLRGVEAEV